MNKALQQNPNLADAYLERGKAKYSLEENKAAIEDFNLALKYKPNFADTYLARGKAKHSLDDKNAAIEDFDLALKYKSNLIDAYIERGIIKGALKQHISALEDFDRAIEIDPKSISAYTWRGVTYKVYLKQKDRGDRDFDLALKIEPKTPKNYTDLALIFTFRKKHQTGIEFFTKQIATSSKDPDSAYGFSNYRQAIVEYDRALSLGFASTYVYRNRGHVKERLDLSNAALADYQQGLKLAQNDGNKELEASLKKSIADIQSQTQRMLVGTSIALFLTGVGYGSLVALARRNEARYLQQLIKQDIDSI